MVDHWKYTWSCGLWELYDHCIYGDDDDDIRIASSYINHHDLLNLTALSDYIGLLSGHLIHLDLLSQWSFIFPMGHPLLGESIRGNSLPMESPCFQHHPRLKIEIWQARRMEPSFFPPWNGKVGTMSIHGCMYNIWTISHQMTHVAVGNIQKKSSIWDGTWWDTFHGEKKTITLQ